MMSGPVEETGGASADAHPTRQPIAQKEEGISSSRGGFSEEVDYDSKEDQRLLRKLDGRLLPILTFLYLLSFLDRSNIGNAKLDGLTTDIGVSGPAYNTSLALYFIGYVIFEVPSNIVLKRFNPQLWLPLITLIWGVVSVCQGLVTSEASLFGVRFLLGVTEAGLFPGCVYLFSVYYRRSERHYRVATFFGAAALAGAFGGILAFAIGKMGDVGGKRGWAWIFILEGLLTILVSLGAFFVVPTWAHKAKFLSASERSRLLSRLAADSDAAVQERFAWRYVVQALTDPLVWGYALLFHGYAFALYSLSLFLPTIIAGLGFASWQAQLLTVPPYVVASIGIWLAAWHSAKTRRRAPYIIGSAVVAIAGYIILISASKEGAQYFGVHLATLGVYMGNALLLSWPSENISGQTKRATGVAMQICIGDLGAVTGVLLYRPSFSGHQYRKPHIITIGYLLFAIAVASTLWIWMGRENHRREKEISEGEKWDGSTSLEKVAEQGDRHVLWRYQL